MSEPFAPSQARAVDHLPLVERVVRRVARRLPSHLCLEDLVGAGVVGLLEAIRRFDPERGRDFPGFAERRIHGAVIDELRRSDMMARDARQECKRIESAMSRLGGRLHRPPGEEEVARELGLPLEQYLQKLEKLAPVRLKSFDEAEHCRGDPQGSPFEHAATKQNHQALAHAIGTLAARQQQVLHLYYREELTMKEIGEVLDVTESRVCQIMSAATLSLRTTMRAEGAPRGKPPRAKGRAAGADVRE